MDESAKMRRLGATLAQPAVADTLARTAKELLAQLHGAEADAKSTFRAIPLDLYGDLPADVRSAWLFALRKGFAHPAERHPNSIQRMFALNSVGRFETWKGGQWITHTLRPGDEGLSIPADSWHRAPALDEDWVVASFHTAKANRLVEIVGDPESDGTGSSRIYLASS